ncbi:unnamed protein product [Mytilus edulis]|uniref:Endonuclease/exonuclease/phosphatase domain-containing protein n=1 Tax=Mytilus edulis TaxID=6550 RepID=A0A8S3TJC1_MYTED|nr:unnamed protein product [Mytilus edulis]
MGIPKQFLPDILPNFDNFTRCHDSNDPLDGSKLPKGQSGVSILWPESWSGNVKKLKEGNERIVAITLSSNYNICIINAYLPTNDKDSAYEYSECLDIIFDIIQKYQDLYEIILCGDLNGTLLHSRSNKHDKLLKNFVQELGLQTAGNYDSKMTFFHHSGQSSSQIDYILTRNISIFKEHKIWDRSATNSSAHVPVETNTTVTIPSAANRKPSEGTSYKKLLWDEINTEIYNSNLSEGLLKIKPEDSTSDQLQTITNELLKATKVAVPAKPIKLQGPKWKATPTVRKHLKSCKLLYSQWKNQGRPQNHPSHTELKTAKKLLRNSQRIEQAVARKQLYQQIMEKPTTKLFYRLINRNRNSRTSTTTCIEIDGEKEYCHSNQRKVFANYYEDLSMPKNSEYDNSYLDLCQTRQNLIEKFYKENPVTSDPVTETEIQKSIETLNRLICNSRRDYLICLSSTEFSAKGARVT